MLQDADEREAVIAYGEDGRCTRLTRKELRDKALALAGWMQSKGIGKETGSPPTFLIARQQLLPCWPAPVSGRYFPAARRISG